MDNNCAVSTNDKAHSCQDPIALMCGHFICKQCMQHPINESEICCDNCDKFKDIDVNNDVNDENFDQLLEKHLSVLLSLSYEKLKKIFQTYMQALKTSDEKVDMHIEFVKSSIELRIESLKIELDQLYETLSIELEEIRFKWKSKIETFQSEIANQQSFEIDLLRFKDSLSEQQSFTKENIFYYQNKIKQLEGIVAELEEISPKLEFNVSECAIEKDLIGELVFDIEGDVDMKIVNNFKQSKYERFGDEFSPYDLCVLPNGNLLFADYNQSSLQLFDCKMKHIKTITRINRKPFQIVSISSDGNDKIYMSDYKNSVILKTDLDFKQLGIYGNDSESGVEESGIIKGICFYNKYLYVCNIKRKCIEKLDSNLGFVASFSMDFRPAHIKNINKIAIVKPLNELCVYFYDLNEFSMLKKYPGHNGFTCTSQSYFYEYYPINKTLYCYNKSGEFMQQIQIESDESRSNDTYCAVFVLNSKLWMSIKKHTE